jgi:hypothetical protein
MWDFYRLRKSLTRGDVETQRLLGANRIAAAALHLRGETRIIQRPDLISIR